MMRKKPSIAGYVIMVYDRKIGSRLGIDIDGELFLPLMGNDGTLFRSKSVAERLVKKAAKKFPAREYFVARVREREE